MTARLRVDLEALAANYRQCSAAGPIAAVVKADAYGCGAVAVGRHLAMQGCHEFFVATCAEGLALRAALPGQRIFVFEGPRPGTCATLAAARLIPVVNDAAQLALWAEHRALPLAIQVDTGMQRLGFDCDTFDPALLAGYQVALLLSHFACADEPRHATNRVQVERFAALRRRWPSVPVSFANSPAALSADLPTPGLARVGIALYGGNPFSDRDNPMRPVATLEAPVLQVRRVPAGVPLGYGGSFVTSRASEIAIVGIGYADGLSRLLSNRGSAATHGRRVPIVGRVSMDLVHVDVTGLEVQPEDWLEFFGSRVPLAEVAELMQSIDYEVLTSVGPRVERSYHT